MTEQFTSATGLQRRLFDECETTGWDPGKRNSFAEECAHLHEEVSEAFREWRLHKDFDIRYGDDGKPTGIPIELADVLIGLFYNAELHGFDLLEAVEIKHTWNLRRDYQTEGRTLHPQDNTASPVSPPFGAYVRDSGGGVVTLVVDRDTDSYPTPGDHVTVKAMP